MRLPCSRTILLPSCFLTKKGQSSEQLPTRCLIFLSACTSADLYLVTMHTIWKDRQACDRHHCLVVPVQKLSDEGKISTIITCNCRGRREKKTDESYASYRALALKALDMRLSTKTTTAPPPPASTAAAASSDIPASSSSTSAAAPATGARQAPESSVLFEAEEMSRPSSTTEETEKRD